MSTLLSIIEGNKGSNSDVQEQLNLLKTTAEAQLTKLTENIKNDLKDPDNKYPITGHQFYYSDIRVNVTSDPKPLTDIINSIFSGSSDAGKDVVKQTVTLALNSIFGSASTGEDTTGTSFITIDSNVFVVAEVQCWKYTFSSTSVIGNVQNAIAYVVCKAFLDYTRMTVAEIISAVSQQVGNDRSKIPDFINEINAIYALVKPKDPATVIQSVSKQFAGFAGMTV